MSQTIGSSFCRFIPDEYKDVFSVMLAKAWYHQIKGELMLHSQQYGLLPVYISMNTIDSADGQVIGMTITDLSDQKERKNLESLFAQAPAIINLFRGPDHIFEIVHPLTVAFLGGKNVKGISVREATSHMGEPSFISILDSVYQTGKPHQEGEVNLKGGAAKGTSEEETFYTISYQPWFDIYKNVQGVMTYRIDVTDQVIARKNEEQSALALMHKNEELQRINSDLDNFVYTASHDLKAPVSNIEGLIAALSDTLDGGNDVPEELREIIELINYSILKFKETIGDLTEITKIQKNHVEDSNEAIQCIEIIEDVKLSIQSMIDQTKAQIELDLEGCESFHFSKRNFKSIMYNLLSNAIKYRSPDRRPEIFIKMYRSGTQRLLTIRDNGLGMDLQHKEHRIFSMFKRLHDHVEGSGIGLYLVKRIMDNTGGTIAVDSQIGKGTTFTLCFKTE
ncbi:MAG: HAMP domain-containing histidine kinase [Cytophagales bacterium]|nr:HAMP domain-containing histidine kinase [Cytophaga sp.]